MRGEYIQPNPNHYGDPELPPRARRIPHKAVGQGFLSGTTSACAENTSFSKSAIAISRNYLRVRGEYREIGKEYTPQEGTTSACAENTGRRFPWQKPGRNYLRVRGEYTRTCPPTRSRSELPPRARRILAEFNPHSLQPGTTSACAENTQQLRITD